MESTFGNKVCACISDDSMRYLLPAIPLQLVAARDYEPDWLYWFEYAGAHIN